MTQLAWTLHVPDCSPPLCYALGILEHHVRQTLRDPCVCEGCAARANVQTWLANLYSALDREHHDTTLTPRLS